MSAWKDGSNSTEFLYERKGVAVTIEMLPETGQMIKLARRKCCTALSKSFFHHFTIAKHHLVP